MDRLSADNYWPEPVGAAYAHEGYALAGAVGMTCVLLLGQRCPKEGDYEREYVGAGSLRGCSGLLCMRVHRTGETVRWSIRELDGFVEYAFNVHLGQDVLTQIVLEQIRRLPNVQIRWNTRVERIVRNDNDVAVAVSGPEGEAMVGNASRSRRQPWAPEP
jgi:hypothetical protein